MQPLDPLISALALAEGILLTSLVATLSVVVIVSVIISLSL
jgi:hypothetical protein